MRTITYEVRRIGRLIQQAADYPDTGDADAWYWQERVDDGIERDDDHPATWHHRHGPFPSRQAAERSFHAAAVGE